MSQTLLEAIKSRPLLGDGAMGTQLQQAGLESGGCGELWNLDQPDQVLAIQRAYVEAGSDCLITNTFGGSRIMLQRHASQPDVEGINQAAVNIAREAFGTREGYVLGDIGPFGGLMEPYGEVSREEVLRAYREQAEALVRAGVDAVAIETQTVLDEVAVAVEAAREADAPCIIASLAFDFTTETHEIRTIMGTEPEAAAEFLGKLGVDLMGLNCGTGIDMCRATEVIERMRSQTKLPIMAQPNAGQPVMIDLKVVYQQSPEDMAKDAAAVLAAGAAILGACCGSNPEHIRQLRLKLDEFIQANPSRA